MEEIKQVIKVNKERYAIIRENDNITNEIPDADLQLSRDESLFFYVLLMEIRGKQLHIHSIRKKQDSTKENDPITEIINLENDPDINIQILETKRSELYELRSKKSEGIKVRSRARWITEDEKTTKCFCNLEKRNCVSKCMNSLFKHSGEKTSDQSEILEETYLFYKTLYSKRECGDLNFRNLDNYQVPKLGDSENLLLEGPITYDVMLFCLKKRIIILAPVLMILHMSF